MQSPSDSLQRDSSPVRNLEPQIQNLQLNDAPAAALDDGGEREESGVSKMATEGISESDAAATLQKVFRGHRTRRCLADHAIMNREIAWWNVLESASLRHRSETFYVIGQEDTVASRWTRLQKKASKVGKGLSKDEKARKLAIQHWLEAIDPKHRYGHNLQFYYDAWGKSATKEPFFYWLDLGEGKEVDLPECKRSKLQKDQIRYLGPIEREQYEVVVDAGKLRYKKSGEFVHTPKGDKWIFVMSASGKLYIARKDRGTFQHSSFLAGAATKAAGRLLVNNGTLEEMEAHSGHYRPTEENFGDLVETLKELGTDLRMAKVQTVSDDMLIAGKGRLKISPSTKITGICEIDANAECKPELLNLREHQSNRSEITQQLCAADGEKEKCHEHLLNDVLQDPKNLLPSLNDCQHLLCDESVPNRESHVKAEMESSQIQDRIIISDKQAEVTASDNEVLYDKQSARMAVFQPAETNHTKKWTSGAGPGIVSLAAVSQETRMEVLKDVEKPLEASA